MSKASALLWSFVFLPLAVLPVAAAPPAEIQILVPAYGSPCCGTGTTMWNTLIATARNANTNGLQLHLNVIINPASGPGTGTDFNYYNPSNPGTGNQLVNLRNAGGDHVTIYGYVATGFGEKALSTIRNEIDRYQQLYPNVIDGIFLDEMSTLPGDVADYHALYQYIKSGTPPSSYRNGPVIGNPGTHTIEDYLLPATRAADVLVIFENFGHAYTSYTAPEWVSRYPAEHFAHLVHSQLGGWNSSLLSLAEQRNVGMLYITDDTIANPWDALPSYWTSEVNAIEARNCGVIAVSPGSLPAGNSGAPYPATTFTQSGTSRTVTFSREGSLPAGMTFSGAQLSGTPTASGVFPITVTATDTNGCTGSRAYSLVICPSITVNPITLASGTAGVAFSPVTFTQSGTAGAVTFTHTGTLPSGMTFSGGLLSGTPAQSGVFTFTVEATDANGCRGERTYSLTINLPAGSTPSDLVATAASQSRVLLSWTGVADAQRYEVSRSTGGGFPVPRGKSQTTSYVDEGQGVDAGTTYVYYVQAIDRGRASGYSNPDIATTIAFTDEPLIARSTVIRAVHLTELRAAVNAVRAAAGLPAYPFTDQTLNGSIIKSTHVHELRTALQDARAAIGLALPSFTYALSAGITLPRAIDVEEIRGGVR